MLPAFVDPLTIEQKKEFVVKGYLIIRNVIPKDMIDEAVRRINNAIGSPDYITQVCLYFFSFLSSILPSLFFFALFFPPLFI